MKVCFPQTHPSLRFTIGVALSLGLSTIGSAQRPTRLITSIEWAGRSAAAGCHGVSDSSDRS